MGLININVNFDGNWVLTKRNDEKLPAQVLSKLLSNEYRKDFTEKDSSITSLEGQIYSDEKIDDIRKKVYKLLGEEYIRDQVGRYVDIVITGADDEENVLKDIDNLIGWDQFKELCHELVMVTPQIKKNETYEAFQFQNYLFSVNDGCGLSVALEKFYTMVTALSLFEGKNGVFELILTESKEDDRGPSPAEALLMLDNEELHGSLFCFDISDFMERSKYPALKDFLNDLLEMEKDYIFAFRIPFVEEGAMKDIYNMLSDVLFIRPISVLPFSMEELRRHAGEQLKRYNYTLNANVWEVFESRIAQEKSDGKFYGLQTVDKVVWEMLWLKNKADSQKEIIDEAQIRMIEQDEIIDLSPTFDKKQKTGFEELEEMIGMEKISERLKEIVAQVKMSIANSNMERPSIHMRFLGSPGTGKTTVARIVGKIFQEEGILRNGYFFEYTARDLIGEYVGQTAPKTASLCRDAYGSVLFIDEAYGLYWGDDRSADFGREALTTLISEMENHRDDMVVIMAGYKDDMEELMKGNAGLRSRMPYLLEFSSYNADQLSKIYMQMVEKHFKYDNQLKEQVEKYFSSLPKEYTESKEFSNGRFVRNLYERTWSKAALRRKLNDEGEVILTTEDFKAACEEKEFSEKLERKKTLGFQIN